MLEQLPPEIQTTITTATSWLWTQYGKTAVEKTAGKAVDEAKWRWGIERYLYSLYERVGFVRILGRMESEPLENVFTHVNVLDKLSAERRYDIDRLREAFASRDFAAMGQVERVTGDTAVDEFPKLFILGKPGSGKTTFLKHTALRAIKREIDEIPIFVNLKQLSDSAQEILPFIEHQFEVHRFPDPEGFVPELLKDGNAIVLFDGLDEVNLEGDKRARLIDRLNDFVYRYGDCPILITCRVAAVDYSFTQFEYVEMADFDEAQIGRYIDQWFVYDEVKRKNCRQALLEDKQNEAVRELAQVPLLLSLLCLVYEERNEFPPHRDEIYEEAMRALLSKWDASRNIVRDTIYPQLSLKRKQSMLAHIAAETFTEGEYFLPQRQLVGLIETYLQGVPGVEDPDGELVLKAMEAQHGIFVERAQRIHSFSHLTLQEYFTARYVVDNERRGTVERLMPYVGDSRWDEVFLLTAGMLDDATEFCQRYLRAVADMLAGEAQLVSLLHWAEQKRAQLPAYYKPPAMRAFLIAFPHAVARARNVGLDLDLDRDPDLAVTLDFLARLQATDLARILDLDLDRALDLARALDQTDTLDLTHVLDQVLDRTFDPAHIHALALIVASDRGYHEFQDELETLVRPEDLQEESEEERWALGKQLQQVLDKHEDTWNPYRQIPTQKEEIDEHRHLSREQVLTLARYLEANRLLVRCLKVAYVRDRTAIENQILLPPAKIAE